MSGTYRHLTPGRYQLEVESGQGPAGIRRPDGRDVVVGIDGGARSFALDRSERVYYWWRGPSPRQGVRLVPAGTGADRRSTRQPRRPNRDSPRTGPSDRTLVASG